MNSSFEDFLLERKKEQDTKKIDWQGRKSTWLKSIDNLYESIKKWLEPYVVKGLIEIKDEKSIEIVEEYIGSYFVKRLDIYLGNDIISLVPKGTLIVGSSGRIDMRGTKGEIILIEPEWNKWKFVVRTPKLDTWDVTDNSFKDILQELV